MTSRKTKRTKQEMLDWLDARAFDPVLDDPGVPADIKRLVHFTKRNIHRPANDSFSVMNFFWTAQAQPNGHRLWLRLAALRTQQHPNGFPGFEGLKADFAAFCGETPWRQPLRP